MKRTKDPLSRSTGRGDLDRGYRQPVILSPVTGQTV
jgi:hypothetical protein